MIWRDSVTRNGLGWPALDSPNLIKCYTRKLGIIAEVPKIDVPLLKIMISS